MVKDLTIKSIAVSNVILMYNNKYLLFYWTKYDYNFVVFDNYKDAIDYLLDFRKNILRTGKRFNYDVFLGYFNECFKIVWYNLYEVQFMSSNFDKKKYDIDYKRKNIKYFKVDLKIEEYEELCKLLKEKELTKVQFVRNAFEELKKK